MSLYLYLYLFLSSWQVAYQHENAGVFPGKLCSERRKNHGCGRKKPKSTSSAIFGVETPAKSANLSGVPTGFEQNRRGKFELFAWTLSPNFFRLNWTFPASTKKTPKFSFELFFPLTICFWLLLSLLVLLQRGSTCDFAPKTHGIQHRVLSSVGSVLVALWCGRMDVTTKIFWLDRLPNFLSNGAPLTR